ncbi:MAG TPA: hypothetical protein VH374_26575 [Polyangia bacterium]|jgi:hypothetical protein|nr:hypothetical protein [Polyangia bacterium]
MIWEAPKFEEINMSAEIGGYQSEGDDPIGDLPPVVTATARSEDNH